jgi:hypothetical protein
LRVSVTTMAAMVMGWSLGSNILQLPTALFLNSFFL